MLLVRGFEFVVNSPEADHVINTAATVVAGGVAVLAWIRFRETGRLDSLLAAAAFLVLFAGNAVSLFVLLTARGEALGFDSSAPGQAPLYLWTVQRLLAAALLLGAAVAALTGRGWQAGRRGGAAALAAVSPAIVVLLATVAIIATHRDLPALIPPEILEPLAQPLDRFDPALITPPMLVGQSAIAALFLAAGATYGWAYSRRQPTGTRRRYHAYLSAGLIVAAFSQLHFIVVPGAYGGLITSGDVLRVVFYAIIGLGIAAATRQDLSELREAHAHLERLRAADNERIALEERARLARDIHDGLVQDLWLARLTHGQLSQSLAQAIDVPAEARSTAKRLDAILDDALAEARQAVVSLQPSEDASFGQLLLRFVEDYADRFGLEVECAVSGEPVQLPPSVQAEVLRICREAINNARKHADASSILVSLEAENDRLSVTVADNGRGFDSGRPQRHGFGLRGMHERAAAIGGRLDVYSQPMGGTRVILEIARPGRGT